MKKEKFIEIHDDLIHPQIVDQIEDLVFNKLDYKYLQNISHPTFPEYIPGFHHSVIDQFKSHYTNLQFPLLQILYSLSNFKKIDIHNVIATRVFLQLPLPKPVPNNIHTDLEDPHWVCLYYVTDSDGDTILYEDDEKTEIKRVTPKKGRIVFFDGSIKHCSSHPTQTHRAVINFDFIGKYLDKQK
jgi:hypothetical protein